jgi:16S rRNA (adenine(1408)-N(1))-methyltransferase
MTIHFPWGSLLRGVLGHDDAALAGAAMLLAPGAELTVLTSIVARDGVPAPRADLAAVYARHGLELIEARPATAAEVAASSSSWAKRLRAGLAARPVTLVRCSASMSEWTAQMSPP